MTGTTILDSLQWIYSANHTLFRLYISLYTLHGNQLHMNRLSTLQDTGLEQIISNTHVAGQSITYNGLPHTLVTHISPMWSMILPRKKKSYLSLRVITFHYSTYLGINSTGLFRVHLLSFLMNAVCKMQKIPSHPLRLKFALPHTLWTNSMLSLSRVRLVRLGVQPPATMKAL